MLCKQYGAAETVGSNPVVHGFVIAEIIPRIAISSQFQASWRLVKRCAALLHDVPYSVARSRRIYKIQAPDSAGFDRPDRTVCIGSRFGNRMVTLTLHQPCVIIREGNCSAGDIETGFFACDHERRAPTSQGKSMIVANEIKNPVSCVPPEQLSTR